MINDRTEIAKTSIKPKKIVPYRGIGLTKEKKCRRRSCFDNAIREFCTKVIRRERRRRIDGNKIGIRITTTGLKPRRFW